MNSKKVFFEYQNIQLTFDQYKEEIERYNQLFDNLTDSVDIDYVGTGCSEMKRLIKIQSAPNADLVYERGKQYTWDFLYKDLCKRTPDDNLIQFFKELTEDKESKLMPYLHGKTCPCIIQSPEIQKIVLEYYNSEAFQDISNKYECYKPLLFKLAHDIGDIEQIADEYFLSLRNKAKLSNEGVFIYKLAKANKEKKALKYLELLINEVVSGEKKYAAISDEGDPFPVLCLSNNKEISQKATNLMFNYFEKIVEANHYYAYFHLRRLAEFKDINRLKKLYTKWFEDYKQLDFSKKENRDLFRHFISYSMEVITKDVGMPYWKNFLDHLDIFDQDGHKKKDYSYVTMVIGFEVVKSTELTVSEKKSIFEYIRNNCEFDSYPDFYLRNLKSTFPDITLEEAKDMLPEKFKQSYYLKSTWERISKPVSFSNPTFEDAFKDLIKLKIAPDKEPKFSDADKFQHKITGLHTSIRDYFDSLGLTVWYDTEAGRVPVGYKELFDSEFLPILKRRGIYNIALEEKVKKTENGCHYTLLIGDGRSCFEVQFESNSKWYDKDKFIHLVNILLQNRMDVKERFVTIDSGDQTSLFGFFEPGVIKLFTKKYGMTTYVQSWEDEFATK